MASYWNGDRSERDGGRHPGGSRGDDTREGSGNEATIGRLPGIVNDLPEVAPHEWIYIMG